MASRYKIDEFIRLRLRGKTYDEIVKKIGVSKPTLIKWAKLYEDEFEYYKSQLTAKLALKIAKDNEQLINIIAENLKRAKRYSDVPAEVRNKYIKRAYKKLGNVFKIKVRTVDLSLNDNGDVVNVYINAEEF